MFIQVTFYTSLRLYYLFYFAVIVVNIMDVIVMDVDQPFVSVNFLAAEYFKIDPFVVLWKKY